MTEVTLEIGTRKVFATAVEWPGWCRPGRSEDEALDALASYAGRYRAVAERAGVRFPAATGFDVIERVTGDATTDFGAPGAVTRADRRPLTAARGRRLASLLAAAWDVLDAVVAASAPRLRKGPRGGGRDRDAVLSHVVEAERAYGRQIGVRHPPFDPSDRGALDSLRADVIGALGHSWPRAGAADWRWPPRYAAARLAWHALDHAWEIEDKQP